MQDNTKNFLDIFCKVCKECKTVSGPSSNHRCIFPFVLNNVTYNNCALDTEGFWCSTKVDSSGNHIGKQGNWGICGQRCFTGKDNESNSKKLVLHM